MIPLLTTSQMILVFILLVLTFILGYLWRIIIEWSREAKLKQRSKR